MKSQSKFKVSKLMALFVLLTLSRAEEQCERFEQKSNSSVLMRKLVRHRWWHELVTSYESPSLYNYTICNNVTLEIGKELKVKNGKAQNIRYILFQNSTVPTVPVGAFSSYSTVTKLYLNNSGIQIVHPGAFSGMIKLEELYLQDNIIEVLEKGTLNYLSSLKILDISRNRLQFIENNYFLGMLSLNQLFLGQNYLNQSAVAQFKSLVHLMTLDLSNNNLEDFEPTWFKNMQQLQRLLLNNNKLKRFSFKILPLTNVKFLDISYNHLKEINFAFVPKTSLMLNVSHNKVSHVKNWTKLENVTKVDLRENQISNLGILGPAVKILYVSWNKLTNLNASAFKNSEKLIELDLGHNSISVINDKVFQNLVQLQILLLNHNQISSMSVGCFQKLTSLMSLNLSHNSLTNLEFGTFTGLINLDTLVLDHNKLTAIHENSFHVLRKLHTLFLHDNFITSIDVQILLEHIDALKLITLNNNDWTCNTLFKMVKVLRKSFVEVPHGNTQSTANIYGISCKNELAAEGTNMDSVTLEDYDDDKFENSSFYRFFQSEFKSMAFYKFFSDFQKSDFYNYFNGGFVNSDFVKYFNKSKVFKYLKANDNEISERNRSPQNAAINDNSRRFETFVNQNNDLLQYFKILSNRIIIFIAIMTTTLLAITLLFLLFCYQPRLRQNVITKRYNGFTHNEFELQKF